MKISLLKNKKTIDILRKIHNCKFRLKSITTLLPLIIILMKKSSLKNKCDGLIFDMLKTYMYNEENTSKKSFLRNCRNIFSVIKSFDNDRFPPDFVRQLIICHSYVSIWLETESTDDSFVLCKLLNQMELELRHLSLVNSNEIHEKSLNNFTIHTSSNNLKVGIYQMNSKRLCVIEL